MNDFQLHCKSIQNLLQQSDANACLITSSVNIYYLTGQIFDGYLYLPQEGKPLYFVRKPGAFSDENQIPIRKPEDIPALLNERSLSLPKVLGLEAGQLTYNDFLRLQNVFQPEKTVNATALLRQVRMIKTPWEIEQFRLSAQKHKQAYREIPTVFVAGMTDLEFQYEIERLMRKNGSIGIFRTFGSNMDIFMGSVLTGENAGNASPCDFALGGGGAHPSLPIGANGTPIRENQSVMVDMAGNFTAYMTDMTRVFAYGNLPEEAIRAHQTSIEMHEWLRKNVKAGFACSEIYCQSLRMVEKAGLSANFMGIKQQSKFVGHGVGIEINELPVLTERSKEILQAGMVFAYEPKFVLPKTGAVGVENTYLVTNEGLENLTDFEESLIPLTHNS
ncbi:MAG: Xaa-Pro peptidase family protein [Dysgonamonadaceae bacterium]|jgi:Xaa-Pro aminopeptidase|nr:Xaa-Pro peptidase family protein [Dysgonamonadaceae bacterium]